MMPKSKPRGAPMPYSDEDVTNARQKLGNLWPLLRPGLWHSTPAERYGAILTDSEIKPEGGQNGNVYKGSLAVSMKAVSLFDFENADEDYTLGTFGKWSTHLLGFETPVRVWIGLNRDRLPGRLILADEVRELARVKKKNLYPRVEACHVGPIPTCAFATRLAVSTADPCQFEPLASGAAALPRLRELAQKWPNPEPEIVQILRDRRDRNARRE